MVGVGQEATLRMLIRVTQAFHDLSIIQPFKGLYKGVIASDCRHDLFE